MTWLDAVILCVLPRFPLMVPRFVVLLSSSDLPLVFLRFCDNKSRSEVPATAISQSISGLIGI
jgi:hypothetical protein